MARLVMESDPGDPNPVILPGANFEAVLGPLGERVRGLAQGLWTAASCLQRRNRAGSLF